MLIDRMKLGKRKLAPGQASSEDEREQRQHEFRMHAALERRSKHNEDVRAAKGKGMARSATPPPKPRKVMYVTSDSSSGDDDLPKRTSPAGQKANAGDRFPLHTPCNSMDYVSAVVVSQ